MENLKLPSNAYFFKQFNLNRIPGKSWIYWLSNSFQQLFVETPALSSLAECKVGINTGCNERFVRFHWEVPVKNRSKMWRPYVSGGPKRKYFGNLSYVINWSEEEMQSYPGSALRALGYHGKEGLTYGLIGNKGPSIRFLPPGYSFSSGGNCIFPHNKNDLFKILGVLNSDIATYLLKVINPTINLSVGDLLVLPIILPQEDSFSDLVKEAIRYEILRDCTNEVTLNFIAPPLWENKKEDFIYRIDESVAEIEASINKEIWALYGVENIQEETKQDTVTIETEEQVDEVSLAEEDGVSERLTIEEQAVRWISYAVGIVLNRYQVGVPGEIGSAVFRKSDFSYGSLTVPSSSEFQYLIDIYGTSAYLDNESNVHIISIEKEKQLQKFRYENGIGVIDNGQDDLASRVEKVLEILLGKDASAQVIKEATGEDTQFSKALFDFLRRDFFTKWHLKWYRKRPIYWYIQSSKRSYGYVIFHEKITKDTFYAIQREPYLDTKRNAVNLEMQDVQARIKQSAGGERKKLEKRLTELRDLADELTQFAKDLEEITRSGYEPEPDWIDDGISLRMAPLWKLIPLWKSEPKKYWDRIEAGDIDWSHIAMTYWPKRVREKCRKNRSFAIAHGHEEWYEGK